MMPRFLLVTVAGAAAVGRPNLCFNAHSKPVLQCTQPLAGGPIAVYSDGESPQQAQELFFKKGKLCNSRKCRRCMSPGGAWSPCRSAQSFTVHVMEANATWERKKAVLFAAFIVAVPVLVFLLVRKPPSSTPESTADHGSNVGFASSLVAYMLRFASQAWFPLVAGFGTAVNMFTIIFTGATVVLFLAAVLGQPHRWKSTAIVNAAGATAGTAVMLLLVRERGVEYLSTTFPALLASPAWAKATGLMTTYGLGGMLLVSSLPLILHPVIVFGLISGLSNTTILAVVFSGRTIKYLTMAYLTSTAPSALRFFGIKTTLIDYATTAIAAQRKEA